MIEYNADCGRWNIKSAEKKEELDLYRKRCSEASNYALYTTYTALAGADDYDGGYTYGGSMMWTAVSEEFERRLKACGFLEDT